jgi:hypothetical protein
MREGRGKEKKVETGGELEAERKRGDTKRFDKVAKNRKKKGKGRRGSLQLTGVSITIAIAFLNRITHPK